MDGDVAIGIAIVEMYRFGRFDERQYSPLFAHHCLKLNETLNKIGVGAALFFSAPLIELKAISYAD